MTKAERRQKIRGLMTEKRVSRFPGAAGRVPNFVGA